MNQKQASPHSAVNYAVYVFVWLGLVGLTWLTITVAGLGAGRISIFIPLIIASVKAFLVLSFFMNLRYEKGLLRIMTAVAIALFAVFISLVFSDVAYR